jgi:hypothetical protein
MVNINYSSAKLIMAKHRTHKRPGCLHGIRVLARPGQSRIVILSSIPEKL